MDISLFMSAARPQWWERMANSLRGNRCDWEIIAVGPNNPPKKIENLTYIPCDFKPTQCYAIATKYCTGKLIGWTADDATYERDSLDIIMQCYLADNLNTIYVQRTIENGMDIHKSHHFFWNCQDTPTMAPLGFMSRDWFNRLGGYDRNFISGQAENDIVMRALVDGGSLQFMPTSIVYLHHKQCHHVPFSRLRKGLGLQDKFVGKYKFRTGYIDDRRYLEECWVKEGYGTFNEKTWQHGTISPKRLLPAHLFNYETIEDVPQGPQGKWEK